MNTKPHIAIFASGNGSNAQRIAEYFQDQKILDIAAIYCNDPKAFVIERARLLSIPSIVFDRDTLYNSISVIDDLRNRAVDWILLAGFLWLIPKNILKAFPGKILNIHPALLPAYGGKGMYGMKVHQAVIASGEHKSGITIHYVNEQYDKGDIIFQAHCPVLEHDTAEILATRIHSLEYEHYPKVIRELIEKKE